MILIRCGWVGVQTSYTCAHVYAIDVLTVTVSFLPTPLLSNMSYPSRTPPLPPDLLPNSQM